MIPDFDREYENVQGYLNLPIGVHEADWDEFCIRYITNRRRIELKEGMESMLQHLRDVGCKFVKIDGSFVTSKSIPNDFDGTWDPEGVDVTKLDPIIGVEDKNLMIEKYNGELYSQDAIESWSGKTFDKFFQMDRLEKTKGIVKINLESLP